MMKIFKLDSLTKSDLSEFDNKYVSYSIRMTSTNQYYVGYTDEIVNRIFNNFYGHLGSLSTDNMDYIHVVMRKNPINDFELTIEGIHRSEEDALADERRLVIKYNSFDNGFNMTNNGFGGTGGRIRVYNPRTKDERFVKPGEVNNFIESGYKKGSNRVVVSPPEGSDYNFKFKRVKRHELRSYLDKGFTLGSSVLSTTKGNIFVYKGDEVLSIPKDKLLEYESKGYTSGFIPNKNKVHYYNKLTGEIRTFSQFDEIPEGFLKGKCKYGNLYKMTNGINTVRVKLEDIPDLLNNNYIFTN